MSWLLLLLSCGLPPDVSAVPDPLRVAAADAGEAGAAWPEAGARLSGLILPGAPVDRPIRVFLDPGHGDGTNTGNRGARCQDEEAAMLALADDLAARLRRLGRFDVKSARPEGERTAYAARVARANAWGADVFLSLHSDARGAVGSWEASPGVYCERSDLQPGYAILVSDETGSGSKLLARRAKLADAIAKRMAQTGFAPYDGFDYGALYDAGPVPGTFLDRRGLMMLRRPTMPSVIIETHHALHLPEVARWDEEVTREAFARAVAHGIYDAVE